MIILTLARCCRSARPTAHSRFGEGASVLSVCVLTSRHRTEFRLCPVWPCVAVVAAILCGFSRISPICGLPSRVESDRHGDSGLTGVARLDSVPHHRPTISCCRCSTGVRPCRLTARARSRSRPWSSVGLASSGPSWACPVPGPHGRGVRRGVPEGPRGRRGRGRVGR